ncbi:MAG: L-threonylcarbamoyladenylate synthase [Pseudomonadales bacterium]|nr:L-threonylcarbamoyladenylate synthase [Pseudomonadales bacterium]
MAETGTDIARAAALLRQGQLVAIPTETVYGLAANGLDEEAVLSVFRVKNRPAFDPLILHVDTLAKVEALVLDIPAAARRLAARFWPGPLTLLLEKSARVPDLVSSGLPRVAVRIPAHPLTTALLMQLDFPLAAPSANPFGYVSPTTALHVQEQLGEKIPYILDGGPCGIGVESTIIGFEEGQTVVYRLGGTSLEDIKSVTGTPRLCLNQSSNPAAPGMIKSHYAPRKPLLVGELDDLLARHPDRKIGLISFDRVYSNPAVVQQLQLSAAGSLDEAAMTLFGALRQMDKADIDLILAQQVPDTGLGRAINDRLRRAAVRQEEA